MYTSRTPSGVIVNTWTGNASSSSFAMTTPLMAYGSSEPIEWTLSACWQRVVERFLSREGAALDERRAQIVVEGGEVPGRGVEDVARQASIARADLDEIEVACLAALQLGPDFCNLDGQHLAEQRTDVDARKEVAGSARTLPAGRVVAVKRIVERELRERRDGHRSALTDQRRQGIVHPAADWRYRFVIGTKT